MSLSVNNYAWRCLRPGHPSLTFRLLCLHHAAGSARFFQPWGQELATDIELWAASLPGRDDRLNEPPITNIQQATRHLADHFPPTDKPWILFGHSMGAALGYELCQFLRQLGRPLPDALVISAQQAPHCHPRGCLHQQPDYALLSELKRVGATPPAFFEIPELCQLILPMLRADYQLIESWPTDTPSDILSCPIELFLGDNDEELKPEEALPWAAYTSKACRTHRFAGDHFYLIPNQARVVNVLEQIGRECVQTRRADDKPPLAPVIPTAR